MKKITWITADCFIDVDLPVIPIISKSFEITWYIVLSKTLTINYDIIIQKSLKKSQLKLNIIKLKNRIRNPFLILEYLDLIKKLKNEKADIYYINMPGMPYFLPLIRCFLGSKKVIIVAHNVSTPRGAVNSVLARFYMNFTLFSFKKFHVFSFDQMKIINKKYNNKIILLAPLAIKDYGESKKSKNVLITFLNFGIIRDYKRVDVLINAANLAYEKTQIKFIVKIAGKCSDWHKYQNLIKYPFLFDLRIESIPNEDIAELFAVSHYFVLPYQDIAQSGALSVALNYNLPVLASNLPAFKEYILDGKTGFLFEVASVKSLSDLIVNILYNHDKIYDKLRLQQKIDVDNTLHVDSIVNKYIEFFNTNFL